MSVPHLLFPATRPASQPRICSTTIIRILPTGHRPDPDEAEQIVRQIGERHRAQGQEVKAKLLRKRANWARSPWRWRTSSRPGPDSSNVTFTPTTSCSTTVLIDTRLFEHPRQSGGSPRACSSRQHRCRPPRSMDVFYTEATKRFRSPASHLRNPT